MYIFSCTHFCVDLEGDRPVVRCLHCGNPALMVGERGWCFPRWAPWSEAIVRVLGGLPHAGTARPGSSRVGAAAPGPGPCHGVRWLQLPIHLWTGQQEAVPSLVGLLREDARLAALPWLASVTGTSRAPASASPVPLPLGTRVWPGQRDHEPGWGRGP